MYYLQILSEMHLLKRRCEFCQGDNKKNLTNFCEIFLIVFLNNRYVLICY